MHLLIIVSPFPPSFSHMMLGFPNSAAFHYFSIHLSLLVFIHSHSCSCSFFFQYTEMRFLKIFQSLLFWFTPFTPSATFNPFIIYIFCFFRVAPGRIPPFLRVRHTCTLVGSFTHFHSSPTKSLDCAGKSRSTSAVVVSLDRSTTVSQDQVHVSTALLRQWC